MRTLLAALAVLALCASSAWAGDLYDLKADPGTVKAGKGELTITIHHPAGRKINTDFPTKLKLTPPSGIIPAKSEYRRTDFASFSENELLVRVPYTVTAAGVLQYVIKFGTCAVENGQVKSCVPHTHNGEIRLAP